MRLTVHCWCYKCPSREGDETGGAGGWKLSCVATPVLRACCLYVCVCVCVCVRTCVSGASLSLINRLNLSFLSSQNTFFLNPVPPYLVSPFLWKEMICTVKRKRRGHRQYLLLTSASFSRLQPLQNMHTLRPLSELIVQPPQTTTTYYFTYPLPFAPRSPFFFK